MAAGLLGVMVILAPILLGMFLVLLPAMLWAREDRRTPTVPARWERTPRPRSAPQPGGGSGWDPRWDEPATPFADGSGPFPER